MYNVFNTLAEATTAQESDFQAWKATKPQMPEKYWEITTAWAVIKQRDTDGKYVYPVCPEGDQTHTQEELSEDWFSTVE